LITIREINGARETSGFTTINIDGAEVLEVKMNYNYDLGDDGLAGGAIGALDQWDADRMEAERMCRSALTEAL
jgi:hypothetical protein